jgi:hypothetical protein
MENKNEEKGANFQGKCHGFLGHCVKGKVVRIILSIFIAVALFSLGSAWGAHMVSRYSRSNNGFYGRGMMGSRHSQSGRGGCDFRANQGQYQRGRMMNNNQTGANGAAANQPPTFTNRAGDPVNASGDVPAPAINATPSVQ